MGCKSKKKKCYLTTLLHPYIQINWKMKKDPRGIESMTFQFIGLRSNQLSYQTDNFSFLTIQYTYKYIQIHWKMEKDP